LLERGGKMPEEQKEPKGLTWLYVVVFIFYAAVALQGGGEYVISEPVSKEADFKINLTEGVNYKLWIENVNGPERINVTIRKGSSVAFEDTFTLTKSKKNYIPYHPKFTVRENGTYHVHAKPLGSGIVNLTIEKSITPKFP
jgi:hypothetical protein